MEAYQKFQIGTIVWAYYLEKAEKEQIRKDIEQFLKYMPLKKAYLENHRGWVDVKPEKMRMAKEIFLQNGIEVSGCITSTGFVRERKPSIYDTYCYTDPLHREVYLKIVEELAAEFDEIILDDYFFTACRCEKCIEAKGDRSWSEYRLELMEEFSRVITKRAKEINPKMNFIIKYPNWYESWQETGYHPEKQKDIFDMVYTGTETREAKYSAQHLQRYQSYSMVRYLENIAPGRNGGGWIDPWGSQDNQNRWLEQADLTLYAGARELMLFNFELMVTGDFLPRLGLHLTQTDQRMKMTGKPVGAFVYEPYEGEGEDLFYTYLGMTGIPLEVSPYFHEQAPVIFLAESASVDRNILSKIRAYIRKGGNVIATSGFLKSQMENGITDLTSLKPTGRHLSGVEYLIDLRNGTTSEIEKGEKTIGFEALQYKTNASWSDVSLLCEEYNFPILSEDDYGKGRFFVLNVPDNFADFSHLPCSVHRAINKMFSFGMELYVASDAPVSMFAYDNGVYILQSYSSRQIEVRVCIKGEAKGIEDLENHRRYTDLSPLPLPGPRMDSCVCIEEEAEYEEKILLFPGESMIFRVIR